MKIKLLIVGVFLYNTISFSQTLVIKQIESANLAQEKIIFEKFFKDFGSINSSNEILSKIVQDAMQVEELDYSDPSSSAVFFHAIFNDRVIGYISCDILPGFHVHIRQLIIDSEFLNFSIIKEMIFAVFENYPKTKIISVSCFAGCQEIIQFFKSFGFVKVEPLLRSSLEFCILYELKINSKCKICELLYPNIWLDQENEEFEEQEPLSQDQEN